MKSDAFLQGLLWVSAFSVVAHSWAADLDLLGGWPGYRPGTAYAAAVAGQYAYLAAGNLQVVDVQDPYGPRFAGWCATDGQAQALALVDHYVLVADGASLKVIDITTPTRPESVASMPTDKAADGIAVSNHYAYVAEQNGLEIFDLTDPPHTVRVGRYPTDSAVYGVAVAGEFAYLANSEKGLVVLWIADPSKPQWVSDGTGGYARAVAVSGDYAYVCCDDGQGMRVIDVRDPANPRVVGALKTTGLPYGLAVSGNYVYLADTSSAASGEGLVVVDVSNPAAPQRVGLYDLNTTGGAFNITFSGNYGYLSANGQAGFQILDLGKPMSPQLLGQYQMNRSVNGVARLGKLTYVADGTALQVIDLSDSTKPKWIRTCDTWASANWVTVSGNYAYVMGADFMAFDLSDPANPQRMGSCDPHGWSQRAVISGGHAYVAAGEIGLSVLDLTKPAMPRYLRTFKTAEPAQGVAVSGNYAYVAELMGGIEVMDVSDPLHLRTVGKITTPSACENVVVFGQYAYGLGSGVDVLDLFNPAQPRRIGTLWLGGSVRDLVVSGTLAYAAQSRGITAIDLSDLTKPNAVGQKEGFSSKSIISLDKGIGVAAEADGLLVLGSDSAQRRPDLQLALKGRWPEYRLGGQGAVAVTQDNAFVVNWPVGLQVMDLHDPGHPRQIGEYLTSPSGPFMAPVPLKVAVSGTYAFLAVGHNDLQGSGELQVLSISDPIHPKLIGSYATSGWARGVAIRSNYVYLADDKAGLLILDVSTPTNPALVGACATGAHANAVAVEGDYAYITSTLTVDPTTQEPTGGDLHIFDIADLTHPRHVGSYAIGGGYAVAGKDHYVYAGAPTNLLVIDVMVPDQPRLVGSFPTSGIVTELAVSGHLAYVTGGEGLYILDVTDPTRPRMLASTPLREGYGASGVALGGQYAYVTSGDLHAVNVSNPADPRLEGRTGTFGAMTSAVNLGDLAYAIDGQYLRAFDLRNTSHPEVLGQLIIPECSALTVSSNFAYVLAGGGELNIIDVTSPSNLRLTGTLQLGGFCDTIALSGHYALVTGWNENLHVVDVANPASPVLVTEVSVTVSPTSKLATSGHYVYVAAGPEGLVVIDIADPTEPKLVGAAPLAPGPGLFRDIALVDHYACVASGDAGLLIFDISDPTQPKQIGRYPSPSGGFGTVTASGNYVYAADNMTGIQVIDISDPAQPHCLVGVNGFQAERISVSGNRICVAAVTDGLLLFSLERMLRFGRDWRVDARGFHASLRGEPGQRIRLQQSIDAQTWHDWRTVITTGDWQEILDANVSTSARGFYRAVAP